MKKILLVEDDKYLVRVYKLKLEQLGYKVVFLEDGKKIIETIKKEKPDLVLLDIILPEKDGFQIVKEIRSNTAIRKIPIIVLSILSLDKDIQEMIGSGATHYLAKISTTFDDVVATIKKFA